jgi:hypothetical protein
MCYSLLVARVVMPRTLFSCFLTSFIVLLSLLSGITYIFSNTILSVILMP